MEVTLRLPHTLHVRTASPVPRCEGLTRIGRLPAAALAAGSYLKTTVASRRVIFVTPPPDSMGP
jgi:hypothetical protein